MSQSRIELLQRMPVFHGIRDDALRVLLESVQIVRRQAGEYFFRQGDDALYMYVLESGRASVHKSWGRQDIEIASLVSGDCFGEIALIEQSSRSAAVRAETPCTAIEISAVHLYQIHGIDIEQFIAIQANIARELCRRLRLADEKRLGPGATAPDAGAGNLAWPQILAL
jgi:CRP-like cAMP-binding protein